MPSSDERPSTAKASKRFVVKHLDDLVDRRGSSGVERNVAPDVVLPAMEEPSGTTMDMHGVVLWRIADGRLAARWAKTTSMSPLEGSLVR